jgi:tetratricopeptide (TPR) repeat protein
MIDWKATRRRWELIATALGVSAFLLRGQLSTALVARADALSYAGDVRAASLLYVRALALDPENDAAVDRIALSAIMSHEHAGLERAVVFASAQLSRHAGDATIRMDRALCLHLLQRYSSAVQDFEIVGRTRHDPQALLFAAADARRTGRTRQSRRLLVAALRWDPAFVPARLALMRSGAKR